MYKIVKMKIYMIIITFVIPRVKMVLILKAMKIIANAKLMRAVSTSGDELRYVLALGLRSLTLQTGDEYRERIGLSHDELAVLVGDAAARDLHEAHRKENIMEDKQMERNITVNGMMCPNCERHVKEALEKVEGVAQATSNHQTNSVALV